MALRANYGDVFLSLPRCFRGPMTIRTGDDRISLFPALDEYASLISDVPGLHAYFVGTQPHSGKWGNGSLGSNNGESVEELLDELTIDGKFTSVRINWDGKDEVPIMRLSGWQAFCGGAGRLFTTLTGYATRDPCLQPLRVTTLFIQLKYACKTNALLLFRLSILPSAPAQPSFLLPLDQR